MLVHVGYPKTGSTWLQRHLFGRTDAGLLRVASLHSIRTELIAPNALWYERQAVDRMVRPGLRQAGEEDLVPVVSHELLVGHPVAGGFGATEIARRLNELWPDARILIVLREQSRMLFSLYAEYARNSGPLNLTEYLDPPGGDRQPVFDFRFLEFDRLIRSYQILFGSQNVKVMAFEQIADDPLGFCNEVLAFADAKRINRVASEPVRATTSATNILLRSRTNRWLSRDRNNHFAPLSIPLFNTWLGRLDKRWPRSLDERCRKHLMEVVDRAVGDRFAASNRRTSDLIDLDLALFGYEVAE